MKTAKTFGKILGLSVATLVLASLQSATALPGRATLPGSGHKIGVNRAAFGNRGLGTSGHKVGARRTGLGASGHKVGVGIPALGRQGMGTSGHKAKVGMRVGSKGRFHRITFP